MRFLSKKMEQMTFDFLAPEETEENIPRPDEKEFQEWKQKKKEAKARFTAMQNLPYEIKVKRARYQKKDVWIGMEPPKLFVFLKLIGRYDR